ncbi:MAG: isocitrate lyase, partial [Saprospiraceae bacterium]|nr:isocitrate lyase [Saprospiraceae bacterium]
MQQKADNLRRDWATNARWAGVQRPYTAEEVLRLRGAVDIEYSLARRGAEKLWKLLQEKPFVGALGALTGNQAIQEVAAGLDAIYL